MSKLWSEIKFIDQDRYNLYDILIMVEKTNKTRGKEEYTHTIHIRIPGNKWLELKPKTDKRKVGNKTMAEIIYKHRREIIRWLLND